MNAQTPSDGLGSLLQSARRRAGLTQEQLAGLSTVSVRAIRDLEQGRVEHPRKETLPLLADALRLSGPRRAALELAVTGASVGSALRDVYDAELAPPPVPLSPLAGRRAELRALTELLATDHERLLSVVGLPGVGKTRLAQEAALRLYARDRIPVLWVPRDRPAAGNPAGTAAHSAQRALVRGVRALVAQEGGADELAAVIRDRATLIVLDGHDVAPAVEPALLGLLHSCERLKVLITARAPHPAPGGRLLPLAPLPLPAAAPAAPGDSLTAGRPAVELMMACVGLMRPDLLPTDAVITTVARICRALDGLPQAMEAAASWLLMYSPQQLLEIARRNPLSLVGGTALPAPGAGPELSILLTAAVDALPDRLRTAVAELGDVPEPWTVQDAAPLLGRGPADAARDVHALLVRGLLRQVPAGPGTGETPRYAVLRLIRAVTDAARTTAFDATAVPVG
ncbi:helix-turn-helix domain-containing protein [Streptomyces sp. NPDC087228]|uniref:helix-turn-helix domain-containing protein n=1 Tax=Streptomyces sp. NPDC087228 TaxID=3365772 RepID=UPI0038127B56